MIRRTSTRRTSARRSSRRLLANAAAPQTAKIVEISQGTKLCLSRVSRQPGSSKDLETVKTVDRIERGSISDGWEEARVWLRGTFAPRTSGSGTRQPLRPMHAYVQHGILIEISDKHAKYEVLGISR